MYVLDMAETVKPFCRICEQKTVELEEEHLTSSFKREQEFGSNRHTTTKGSFQILQRSSQRTP